MRAAKKRTGRKKTAYQTPELKTNSQRDKTKGDTIKALKTNKRDIKGDSRETIMALTTN